MALIKLPPASSKYSPKLSKSPLRWIHRNQGQPMLVTQPGLWVQSGRVKNSRKSVRNLLVLQHGLLELFTYQNGIHVPITLLRPPICVICGSHFQKHGRTLPSRQRKLLCRNHIHQLFLAYNIPEEVLTNVLVSGFNTKTGSKRTFTPQWVKLWERKTRAPQWLLGPTDDDLFPSLHSSWLYIFIIKQSANLMLKFKKKKEQDLAQLGSYMYSSRYAAKVDDHQRVC